ncbi:hypothetical protein TI03_00080 [Achromatium sp. WMS1]|nr:hypothetical protein TI03_00080 [Achromatium sp. WMS1]
MLASRVCTSMIFVVMMELLLPLPAHAEAATAATSAISNTTTTIIPVFNSPDVPEILQHFKKDQGLFYRYFRGRKFKSAGFLMNIFGLSMLNVYSANIVVPHGEINCTPALGEDMEHLEYLHETYKPGQPVLILGTIIGVTYSTIMLTPCYIWSVPDMETLTIAANRGDSEAQYQLGETYSFGLGLAGDTDNKVREEWRKLGLKWYERAAEQGHVGAKEALKLFADREHLDAYKTQQDRLAQWIQKRREHIAKYAAASVDQLYKTANHGDTEAQMNLGRRYLEGKGVTKDEKMGVKYLFKAASQGNPRAFYVLQQAATPGIFSAGSAEAAFALGKLYASGQGIEANDYMALQWFRKAAEQDYPGAIELVKLHDAKILATLQQAAAAGDPEASLTLAKRYLTPDNGTEYGLKEAIPLLIRATLLGNAEALELLEAKARSGWFSYGDANAAFALGEIFSKGMGVQVDLDNAMYWYEIASQQNIAEAKIKLDELKRQASQAP